MRIAGLVDIPVPAVAELAQRLEKAGHTALAQRFRDASDSNSDRVGLFANEQMVVLSVLEKAPPALSELRAALQEQTGGGHPRAG